MNQQRGGTFLGFILGVVVGMGAALAVAMYVTKVPVPFVTRAPGHSADQDVAETAKNKDWDPNSPLYGKNPAKAAAPSPAVSSANAPSAAMTVPSNYTVVAPAPVASKPEAKPTADPLGDLAKQRAAAVTTDGSDPYTYFVQTGAYSTPEDAENQRAKLALMGVEANVSERILSGKTMYRVRVGPFDNKEDADKSKEKLDASGHAGNLVRVPR